MGAEQPKPILKPGSLVQFLINLGGRDITGATSPISTPRLPGSQATIVNDGSDGHSLGSGAVVKPPKAPSKNSQPL
ncbi:hypothetical protein COZ40_00670 [Candidatus Roizmanbacteria bacterium CG_4_10_14_3_um_filter_39_13]|uniref:Uncharacterized protein n=1 Tax=Candidatus Roizmanbacteria bacterium CG_4_10_14_3_um_filter_39_13 TaxID=1974831 RepID=A0A2M7LLJ9_9BACT|nr:MAG: hypothetical protein COZ40_00670 [Candidatus Roizmanbacteria bacterium CG_4_10_14_3_um_filter_39_13]